MNSVRSGIVPTAPSIASVKLGQARASALGLIDPGRLVVSQGVSALGMAPAENSPARGYLEANRDTQNSLQLLGSPLSVTLTQEDGAIYVALLPLFERQSRLEMSNSKTAVAS